MSDDLIQQAIDIERARDEEEPAMVIRYALVAEVMEPGADQPCLLTLASDNLASWQMRGFAWALEQEASDTHIIDQE